MTTAGFTTVPQSEWPAAVVLLSIVLMLIGGASGSTAGGIKLYRFAIVVQTIRWFILRPLLPAESKIAVKLRGEAIESDTIKQAFSIASLYLLLATVSSLCFLLYGGASLVDAVFESASAIGTVGLSSGLTSPSLPALLKLVLVVDMWLGRLEILPVLVVLNPAIWLPKGVG
jgi:trk system potassium uptake protein TrkH